MSLPKQHRSVSGWTLLGFLLAGPGCGGEEMTSPGPGELRISIITDGLAPDPDGYLLQVDKRLSIQVPVNSEHVFEVTAGQHDIRVSDVAESCILVERQFVRFVRSGAQAPLEIRVSCLAPGTLLLATSTTGADPDPDGYLVVLDNGLQRQEVGPNAEVQVDEMPAGTTAVELRGVAGNCSVQGGFRRSVAIEEQATTPVRFVVACTPRVNYPPGEYIIVSRRGSQALDLDLYLLSANGATLERLTDHPGDDLLPSLSPDGYRIAFLRSDPVGSYPSLLMLDAETRQETVLPEQTLHQVNWSPDGSRLVINLNGRLVLANPDGSTAVQLTADSQSEGYWSRDGTRVAFTRGSGDQSNVFVIYADGSDLRQVTRSGNREAGPWSPRFDDLLLVRVGYELDCSAFRGYPNYPDYTCTRLPFDMATVEPATGIEHKILTTYDEFQPAWSPNGLRVLFLANDAGQSDLFWIGINGDQLANLTGSFDSEASFSIGRLR